MDAQSWFYVSEAVRCISISAGIVGVAWAVVWMLVSFAKS